MPTKEQPVDASDKGRSSAPPFDLSSFQLEQAVLEIRYPVALALWDESGALWRSVQAKWPEIQLTHAEPVKTAFRIGKNALNVETELARITAVTPERSLEDFSATAKEFLGMATQHLQVSLYKRVGLRLVYFKEFKDKKEAASSFFSLRLIKVPDGKKFEIEDQPIDPQYVLVGVRQERYACPMQSGDPQNGLRAATCVRITYETRTPREEWNCPRR